MFLDLLSLSINAALLPPELVRAMLIPASFLIPAAVVNIGVWRYKYLPRLQCMSLVVGLFFIFISVALVGVSAGAEFYERHLHIMIFVSISAIITFSIPMFWTVLISSEALGIYLWFQLKNPDITTGSAAAATLFVTSGVVATLVARHTMNILSQKSFLLELRDRSRVSELNDTNARLEQLANTDPLTGLLNRRSMAARLDSLWRVQAASGGPIAILMCDIDCFKGLNDTLGHAEGDVSLSAVGSLIRSSVRDGADNVSRFGGEEFLVALPGLNEREAFAVAERIRTNVVAAALANPASRVSPYVSLSIGVAVCWPKHGSLPENAQMQADLALYRAKNSGRNCVVLHT